MAKRRGTINRTLLLSFLLLLCEPQRPLRLCVILSPLRSSLLYSFTHLTTYQF